MTLSKNAFALHGWLIYWRDRFGAAKDHAALEAVASECDTTAPDWVSQEYLFKARHAYQTRKRVLDAKLKG